MFDNDHISIKESCVAWMERFTQAGSHGIQVGDLVVSDTPIPTYKDSRGRRVVRASLPSNICDEHHIFTIPNQWGLALRYGLIVFLDQDVKFVTLVRVTKVGKSWAFGEVIA